jgi:Tfp pilus assembly protein PilZ
MSQPPEDENVPGQALNLSERGMFIGTDRPYEIGSTIRLRLPLGSDELDVAGRVAWTRPLPRGGAPAGVGVEFTDLSSESLDQIKTVIGSDREHGIRVRFAGLPGPIRARAAVSGDGLSLHTELPFLRLGSLADFSLEGDATSHRGRIRRVSIEPGGTSDVPRLRIEVDVLGVGSTDSQPVVYGRSEPKVDDSPESEDSGPAPVDVDAESEPSEELQTPPQPAIEVPAAAPQWIEPSIEGSTEKVIRHRHLAPVVVTSAAAALGFAGTFALLGHDGAALSAPAIELPAGAAETTPAPAFAFEPPAHPGATVSAPVGSVVVRTTGETTTIRLTVAEGTTDGLTHYLLSDPTGVAINLPGATVEAEHKVHWTESGHAKKVWVRSVEEGDQVRIFFPDGAQRSYRVDTDGTVIDVTITR